jgi:hypothetical protein
LPSLNALAPESVAHGAEIQLKVQQSDGSIITYAELLELQWDEDNKLQRLPVLGSRRQGARRGSFLVSGSFRGYYINGAVRAQWQGQSLALSSGAASAVYHSQTAYTRYLITTSAIGVTVNFPTVTLYNVTLEKDALKMGVDKVVDEVVTFWAEDVFGF